MFVCHNNWALYLYLASSLSTPGGRGEGLQVINEVDKRGGASTLLKIFKRAKFLLFTM